jgi:hypothetical protein
MTGRNPRDNFSIMADRCRGRLAILEVLVLTLPLSLHHIPSCTPLKLFTISLARGNLIIASPFKYMRRCDKKTVPHLGDLSYEDTKEL